jgi:hypothetical protein
LDKVICFDKVLLGQLETILLDTKISESMCIIPGKEFLIEVDKDFELFVGSDLPIVPYDFLQKASAFAGLLSEL